MITVDAEQMMRCTRQRIGGTGCKILREFLHSFAGSLCVVCELPTRLDASAGESDRAEMGHLIPASAYGDSTGRTGYVPGNLANTCRACNSAAASHHFRPGDFREDLVPMTWPALTKPRESAAKDSHAVNAARRRAERGLPF